MTPSASEYRYEKQFCIEQKDGKYLCSGPLLDAQDFGPFRQQLEIATAEKKEVLLDLSNITKINSISLHYFSKLLNDFKEFITLEGIPVLIVDMMNASDSIVPPEIEIRSFYVPFYHPEKGVHESVLVWVGKDIPVRQDYEDFNEASLVPKERGLVPDFDPSEYFHFLIHR